MYGHFKSEVLSGLSGLSADILYKVSVVLDSVSIRYDIKESELPIDATARERFKEIADAYIMTKRTEGLSPLTLYNDIQAINAFVDNMHKPIESVKANDIRLYLLDYQQKRNVTSRTLDGLRSKICAFFHWCTAEGYLVADPATNVKAIKYVAKPRKALSQLELEKVRRACKTDRERCIVEVLYSTGCRVSELCSIKLTDIDFDKKQILVLGKGGKYREVYLNAKALISIQAYLSTRKHASEYLLCNDSHGGGQMQRGIIEEFFRRIESETNIRVTPHIMRHTMATQALTGTSAEVVQQMLGHSNIATTMIYAEVDKKNIHMAHERCVI